MAVLSNAAGALVLADGCTDATFAGPPIVAYGAGLTWGSTDRWDAAQAMADAIRSPLLDLGTPLVGAGSPTELAALLPALARHSRWWRMDRLAAPQLVPVDSDQGGLGTAAQAPVICGPILVMPSTPSLESLDRAEALDWSRTNLARPDAQHPYGIGLSAASSSYPWLSPPVYAFTTNSWRSGLAALALLWLRPPRPTSTQHDAKAALVASDPDRHRCLHPSLLASTLVTT